MSCPWATYQGSASGSCARRILTAACPGIGTGNGFANQPLLAVDDPLFLVHEPRYRHSAQCNRRSGAGRPPQASEGQRPFQKSGEDVDARVVLEPPDLRGIAVLGKHLVECGRATQKALQVVGVRVQQVVGLGARARRELVVAVHDSESARDPRRVNPSNRSDDVRFSLSVDEFAVQVAPRSPEPDVVLAFEQQKGAVVRLAAHRDLGNQNAGRLVSLHRRVCREPGRQSPRPANRSSRSPTM